MPCDLFTAEKLMEKVNHQLLKIEILKIRFFIMKYI